MFEILTKTKRMAFRLTFLTPTDNIVFLLPFLAFLFDDRRR